MTTRLWALVPTAVFLLIALFWFGLGGDPSKVPSALIDKPVPETTLPPLQGVGVPGLEPADFATGKPLLVNVFASWCAPCRTEHPMLMALAEEGVPIYGINYKDAPADGLRFLETLGNPYERVGADTSGRAGIEWGVYGVPETFVVSGDGHILHRHTGPLTEEAIEDELRPLITAGRAGPAS